MEGSQKWQLHPQLENDTAAVGDFDLSRLVVMNDRTYPWLILVPRRAGVSEIVDLLEPDRMQLMAEIAIASRALRSVVPCDKLNIAAIGNMVPQLHVHLVARLRGDAAWPRPVWGASPPVAYAPADLHAFVQRIREVTKLA
jgi:diadenosine tetraphosphate (Ap4A) HIT family hydrolase